MPSNTMLVSEYNIVWDALNHYEKFLENMSLSAESEEEELKFDDQLQDLLSTKKTIQYGALNEYGLNLAERVNK